MQPLDVNHAHRCWLHRQHLFVEKTDISDISVFPRRPSTSTLLLFETKFWGTKTLRKVHSFPAAAAPAAAAAW